MTVNLPPTVETEWFDYRHGFVVKVGGRPVYASQTSMRADGVAEFIRKNPDLAQALAGVEA